MKYIVDNKHREFFATNGWIEFEELLPQDKVDETQRAIRTAISSRTGIDQARLEKLPTEDLLLKGHDVWRDSLAAKNIVCHRTFAEIASELAEVKPLRLAYDQVLMCGQGAPKSFNKVATLEEISSMQGLVCGLLIALQRPAGEQGDETQPISKLMPLPSSEGYGLFIAPKAPIEFPALFKREGECYLLIVYSRVISRYVHTEADPHTHLLKKMGYSYGDKLVDQHHPVLFR